MNHEIRRPSIMYSKRLQQSRWLLGLACLVLSLWALPNELNANLYLAKAGEKPVAFKIATCAVSGGFVHLYTALDHGLFEKYGLKPEHIYIRGSGISLAAVAANEVQFLYCAADATLPGLATGVEAKLVAAPLVKLPYVLVARSDIKRPEDLKGKVIGVTRPGDLSARLSRTLVRRLNFAPDEVTIRPIGGSQSERYQAMATGVVHAIIVTPPLDVRAKNDGFNVVYRLIELDLPFIYSSVHASSKMLRERPEVVQKVVAAFAEALHFVEKNPDKAKGSIGKALKLKDEVALQAAYQAYAKDIIDRWMAVSGKAVGEAVELAREGGTNVRKKPEELYDNSFTADLEKSGFLKELWGSELQKPAR